MTKLFASIRQILSGVLGRNTLAMMAGQAGRTCLQATYFILIARGLGAHTFGAFAATVALVGILTPFSGLGTGQVMVQKVSVERSRAPLYWANAVRVTLISGVASSVAVSSLSHWLTPKGIGLTTVACIALADLVFSPVSEVAGLSFMAYERLNKTASFYIWQAGVRLAGAIFLIAGPWQATAQTWAIVYLVTSIPSAVVMWTIATRHIGRAKPDLRVFWREKTAGLYFAVSLSATSVYNDIDKAMLGRLASAQAAGIYSAAYRLVDVSFTPVRSLLAASYPRFFQQGEGGLRATVRLARRIAVPALGYAAAVSVALCAAAGLVPVLLGESYESSVGALRGLAILPLLKATHYLAANSLTGAGFQPARTVAQIGVAVTNVLLNFWLIHAYSWGGAVAASIASDGLLVVLLWGIVSHKLRRSSRPANPLGATV